MIIAAIFSFTYASCLELTVRFHNRHCIIFLESRQYELCERERVEQDYISLQCFSGPGSARSNFYA
jgi:hypothetical protein